MKLSGRLNLIRPYVAMALGLAALVAAWRIYRTLELSPRRIRLNMTAGSGEGLRHTFAELLAEQARPLNIEITVQPTEGSEQALDLLEAGRLDVALVQGGLNRGRRRRIREITPLHVEPLHALVKPTRDTDDGGGDLRSTTRGRINIGEPGSGTHALALDLLRFLDDGSTQFQLDTGAVTFETRSYRQLEAETDPAMLPDVLFMVSSLPSPVARWLIQRWDYRLVGLPFGDAFSLSALGGQPHAATPMTAAPNVIPPAAPQSPAARSHAADGAANVIDRRLFGETFIPAYTYSLDPPMPPRPLPTIGARLLLVARNNLPQSAVERLLRAVFSPGFAAVATPPLTPELLQTPPEYPWHAGTLAYVKRNEPIIQADLLDWMEKSVSILAAALGGLFFLWQGMRSRRQRNREVGFAEYMSRVTEIERRGVQLEQSPAMTLAELLKLQQELSTLKCEALDRFACGELAGEVLMSGFMAQVNDARSYLTRLILHERDNLEEIAERQGASFRELWDRSTGRGPAAPGGAAATAAAAAATSTPPPSAKPAR